MSFQQLMNKEETVGEKWSHHVRTDGKDENRKEAMKCIPFITQNDTCGDKF